MIGTPGPGGVSPSMPICDSHHSSPWSGSGVSVVSCDSVGPLRLCEDEVAAGSERGHGRRREPRPDAPEAEPRVDLLAPARASAADSRHAAAAVSCTTVARCAAPVAGVDERRRSDGERGGRQDGDGEKSSRGEHDAGVRHLRGAGLE